MVHSDHAEYTRKYTYGKQTKSKSHKTRKVPTNTFKVNLHFKPNCEPKFVKTRLVPFAIKPALDHELDRLEQELKVSL